MAVIVRQQLYLNTSLNPNAIERRPWRSQCLIRMSWSLPKCWRKRISKWELSQRLRARPYLLESAPKDGEYIMWAESNAMVPANSVSHYGKPRRAKIHIHTPLAGNSYPDDALFPLSGCLVGSIAAGRISIVIGLDQAAE
ncbi:hypothetical protein BO82DRAFT_396999 [Aspergillus uvarum CBS 121591]|uniref:Phosphomevalonate dehydratase large subunit-like domain-containing protein n=1 Tax=Aspergillus uvarum CBS 121591 TaxID=1448315 RepID=A0A319CNJ1_9EURO|nr:hypothetical protein BO82DRAFT_396999 [Aspergillus uvarum CBS 121591]PYH87066.1 hypothetical protein BO82DRAFT_396999 [Aspergillus uvarum CBS 121591]